MVTVFVFPRTRFLSKAFERNGTVCWKLQKFQKFRLYSSLREFFFSFPEGKDLVKRCMFLFFLISSFKQKYVIFEGLDIQALQCRQVYEAKTSSTFGCST